MSKRAFLSLFLFLVFWLCSGVRPGLAQYKHHGLGVMLGFQNTFNQTGDPQAKPGSRANLGYGVGFSYLSLGIEYSMRFEDNWMFAVETYFSIHSCGSPTATDANAVCGGEYKTPLMFAAFSEIRYLFLTDEFRPFISFGLGFWQTLALVRTGLTAFGPELSSGFEYFFMEELSIGFRLRYGLQLTVSASQIFPFHQLMGHITFNAYL